MKRNYSLLRIIILSIGLFCHSGSKAEIRASLSLSPQSNLIAFSLPAHSRTRTYKSIAELAASLKDKNGEPLKFRERLKLLREQLRAIKQAKGETKNNRTLLTLLTIGVFIGVLVILFNIGYNGGAGLWPVVGLLISIFLLVFFLKRIRRKKEGKKKESNKAYSHRYRMINY